LAVAEVVERTGVTLDTKVRAPIGVKSQVIGVPSQEVPSTLDY
jgi:hypothetical protein